MKKYHWLWLIVFALAFVTCILLVSKNGDVRDTFIKAAEELPYFIKHSEDFTKASLLWHI